METKEIPSYEMFSKQGDKMCNSLVKKIEKKITSNRRYTKEEVIAMIVEGMKVISEKHGEVYDTEPEYHICNRVEKICQSVGYGFQISRFEL